MTHKRAIPRFTPHFVLTLGLVVASILTLGLYIHAERAIGQAHEQRYATRVLADAMCQAAGDPARSALTDAVRVGERHATLFRGLFIALGLGTTLMLWRTYATLRETQRRLSQWAPAQQSAAERYTRAEAALAESELRFQSLFQNAPIGLFHSLPEGRFLIVNPALADMLGYASPEAMVAAVTNIGTQLFVDPAQRSKILSVILHQDNWFKDEIQLHHAAGRIVVADLAGRRVLNADGTLAYLEGFVQDITERQQTAAELARARDAAEAANHAKSEFLANMSHEIRTPLNAILGFAQVLGRDPTLTRAQHDSLATIQRSGAHLLTLINDVLDMAKIESGRMTLQTAPFNLNRLIEETEAFFRQRVAECGLALTIEVPVLPRLVIGDEMKLRQVLINLVGNAVKFTTAGSVRLRVQALTAEAMRFSVSDTGVGISPAEMAQLFEPFHQTASGRQVQGGTGLGLALSRQFVRLMGGELTADSTPNQGSCFSFTLTLPSHDSVAPLAASNDLPGVGLALDQPVCRVLIVDDLPDNREPLRALLESLDPQPPVLDLKEAADGREAVALWEEWQPRLIFMDMRMPVMSGEEATRRIKALMAARPEAVQSTIVALTASAFDEQRDHYLASGCDEFIRKPFTAEELIAILERHAGLRFVRAARPVPNTGGSLSPAAVASRLAACPADWRAALMAAVELGDFGRITALLEHLRGRDDRLEETLTQWAYRYDLDAFSSLF